MGIRPHWAFVIVTIVALLLGAIRLTAPPNLMDQDQEQPSGYVLDAVKNSNWICQRNFTGAITSKPPLYTWVCSLLTVINGRISLATMYLPCVAAGLGVAWMMLLIGRKYVGTTAALFGALMFMLTPAGLKLFGLARTDSLFTLTVTATAFLGWRAWNLGRGWTWFWIAAALAALTKGPLGLVLAAFGLFAAVWERRSGKPQPLKGSHLPGICLFILIAGGWFFLAYVDQGQALIDKMIGKELLDHAVSTKKKSLPGTLIWQPPLYYLGRAAPWSILAFLGLWRVWRRPSPSDSERRFERFLFCWFCLGMLLFSLAPHQRADLLWPLMPAGALIAGQELARRAAHLDSARLRNVTLLTVAAFVVGYAFYYEVLRRNQPVIQRNMALKVFAARLEESTGPEPPITFVSDLVGSKKVGAPATLQVYLNVYRPPVTLQRAANLLNGSHPAFVAVDDPSALDALQQPGGPAFFRVLTAGTNSPLRTTIVGNRSDLTPHPGYAFAYGPFDIRFEYAQVKQASQRRLCVAAETASASVTVSNTSSGIVPLQIEILSRDGSARRFERRLISGEQWTVRTD